MHLAEINLTDFRNIERIEMNFAPEGATVITGRNGSGKTNLLESVAYLSTLRSFRGAPRETMVRMGVEKAFVRAVTKVLERSIQVETELSTNGRPRSFINRHPVHDRGELALALRTTVFAPEDIAVVRGGPSDRRRFLDETLEVVGPRSLSQLIAEVERILRQRSALLRSTRKPMSAEVDSSLDVWDSRLEQSGTALVESREELLRALAPRVEEQYRCLTGRPSSVELVYLRSWSGSLQEALRASRTSDVERGATQVGPHRDDLSIVLEGLPSRSHASQGEQRSLALALRLAGHQLATERLGSAPVLLLDDVFSELDPGRARALLRGLPPGQAFLSTALPPPTDLAVTAVIELREGALEPSVGWSR